MTFTIGSLAKATDVHVETIRYYQRLGLVAEPSKPLGGIRRYDEVHARRLRFIKQAQTLGFSLEEVVDLLALEDGRHCQDAERMGRKKLATVRERIAQLCSVEQALTKLVEQCQSNRGEVYCPLIGSLEKTTQVT
ncbi:Hg(II)-responsive transcriptional regulator [Dyella sp. 20L07]|uniref:Hg(II)-responsive transcriptional regulator n=1 Tax=Dyella sp. 20L07 TaxID=3384240 RepID=UPI003D2E6A57